MLNKADCLSILVKLEDSGIEINQIMKKLIVSKDVPLDVLKFIADNRGIEVMNFYEMLRKKHNKDKSPLYINILKCEESNQDVITTLTCLLTQIVLYSNKLSNKVQFLMEARAEEITRVLNKYFSTGKIDECLALLQLIKTDLLVLEGLCGRRSFE